MDTFSLFDLAGTTAMVTGCTGGIGLEMAIALAEAGADIIGVSSGGARDEVRAAITATGRRFTYYQVDLGNRDAIYQLVSDIQLQKVKIDILVNNAGMILRAPAAEHSDEYWDKVLDVNLTAQFLLAREFGKQMISNGGGKIIFICSLLSFQGGINVPGYSASKSAVAGLVKALANEWSSKGVCVNGIAPGYVVTNNTTALREDKERSQAILSRIPAGRWGLPADFKGPVVFLASKAADYVSGTVLVVDGGWLAR